MIEEIEQQYTLTPEVPFTARELAKLIKAGKDSMTLLTTLTEGSDSASCIYDGILKDEMVIIRTNHYQYSYWKKGLQKDGDLDLFRIPIVNGELTDFGERLVIIAKGDRNLGKLSYVEGVGVYVFNKNYQIHKDEEISLFMARKFLNQLRREVAQVSEKKVGDSLYILFWYMIIEMLESFKQRNIQNNQA